MNAPSTNAPRTDTLKVPGATLHYEIRGSGPVLLMIHGGSGDAGVFEGVAGALADRYTVVTYDRRGNSRSPVEGPPQDMSVATDSEDARLLLAALTDEPAHVFGSSSGAIVALDLLTRHPDRVRIAVPHEPPLFGVLPDADEHIAFLRNVHAIYLRDGVGPAMEVFGARMGLDTEGPLPHTELPPQIRDLVTRMAANTDRFLAHELLPVTNHLPDLTALATVAPQLALAGGRDSRGFLPYRPNTVLATRLGIPITDFPGNHAGYLPHAPAFATRLATLLTR
ncbi:alpha/beta hydrolase [Streptomyces sp. SID13666]|uniref:alpha/beta fold hydrolase n=1 Tax=unclassified Streptomyces TaxID=2593676 RepID=UPI0013C0290C|nr:MULTISPECIES: alpha/beta hydrolase [unclassified Streptomyces]NEA58833.1 alpha/beta hydrolase [Streptomyces sp. SID13666]NEA74538.1 alpha/beta hydrolase [Streptomyces sp. SID13588]